MSRGAYRRKLPRPDPAGNWRPYVGKQPGGRPARFTVGNRRDISEGEAQRRLDAICDLYDRQCEKLECSHWHLDVLDTARQIAAGQPALIEYQRGGGGLRLAKSVGRGIEDLFGTVDPVQDYEAKQLVRLVFATGVQPTDPRQFQQAAEMLQDLVRKEVQSAVGEITGKMSAKYGPIITGQVPADPLMAETRTFHAALKTYCQHIEKTGDRDDRDKLKPHARRCQDRAKWLQAAHKDFPLFQLDLPRLKELISHWRNRPVTQKGSRCSTDHARHMVTQIYSLLRWLDAEPTWKWEMPKGASTIKRKPVTLEQDYVAKRVRRITANTYTPEQLATIASRLDRCGKMLLGLAVNCGMGPGEFGRVEIDDVLLNQPHPEAELIGTHFVANWLIFDRRKTGEYGEWLLWSPVADLLSWGIERSRSLGVKRLAVRSNGSNWYADHAKNGAIYIGKWWQATPTETDSHCGVVTAIAKEVEGFPRLTIKTLRKVLPNAIRPDYGSEVADLAVAHSVGRSAMVDKYSDKSYGKLHEAIRTMEERFAPFLDALSQAND